MTCDQCDTPLGSRNKSGLCGPHYTAWMKAQRMPANDVWGSVYCRKKASEEDVREHFAEASAKLRHGILTMLNARAAA